MFLKNKLSLLEENQKKILSKLEASSDKKIEELTTLLKAKSDKLDEIEQYLTNVHLKVSKIVESPIDESLKVFYEINPISLRFDSNGSLKVDEEFKAINMLNLISLDDMQRLSYSINAMGKKIKNK